MRDCILTFHLNARNRRSEQKWWCNLKQPQTFLACIRQITKQEMRTIAEAYAGRHVLVTGATGFMGKVLLEKLLRSCPDVAAIYILVRTKRDKEPRQRLEEFLKMPLFDSLRAQNNAAELFDKIYCISGDVTQPNLDLCNDDLQLLRDKVDLVFHMAANVRFDQPLKSALWLNTGGTLRLLDLCVSFKKLRGFVHVSTSYCHCDQTVLEEKVYQAPQNPRKMLDLISWMEEDMIDMLTPKLLNNAPNTYAYTKCLTEQLVAEYSRKLPIVISRPSIVTACMKDPIPGWVDNINGPTGLIIGAGKGVIRSMHCNPDLPVDFVPCDLVIRGLVIVGREMLENGTTGEQPKVIHLTSGKDNQITWGQALELGRKHFFENPFSVCLWYPGGSIKSNYFIHMLSVFFFHVIPAYLVDFLILLSRGKPFLIRTQKRISSGLKILQYYTVRPWYFKNETIKRLSDELSPSDKKEFEIDFMGINWDEYVLNLVLGARIFCVKETPDTIPHAKKVMRRLYYLDLAKNVILCLVFFWMLWSWSSVLYSYLEAL